MLGPLAVSNKSKLLWDICGVKHPVLLLSRYQLNALHPYTTGESSQVLSTVMHLCVSSPAYVLCVYASLYSICYLNIRAKSCKNRSWDLFHCPWSLLLVWDHATTNAICLQPSTSIVDVIPKDGFAGLVPAKPSFGMTMTKILRPVFAWCGPCSLFYICYWNILLNIESFD